ncbi:MAG: redoxin domain-containing protein [Myxococcaceae bacterium]
MKRWIITLTLLALCGALVGIFAMGFGRNVHKVPFGLKGQPAPTFSLQELTTGKTISLAELRGKPVVINFWASWCVPCRYEHPVLEWGQREFGRDVVFLGMMFEDTPENAQGFLGRYGYSYPQLIDPNSLTAVQYAVAGVPETYFISPDGTIFDKHVGPISQSALIERLRELVAQAPSASAQEAHP